MNNLEALEVLRDGMALRQAEWSSRPDVIVGDFTYAWGPRINYDAVEAMKEEAIHVVRNMSRWEPGRQNGKRVETFYTLSISFSLQ